MSKLAIIFILLLLCPISASATDHVHVWIGDSITYGHGTTGSNKYADLIEAQVAAAHPSDNWTFFNEAVSGSNTEDWWAGAWMSTKVYAHSPTSVSIMLGTNDADDPLLKPGDAVDIATFTANYTAMVQDLKANGVAVFCITPPGDNGNIYRNNESIAPYAAAVRSVCAAENLFVADVWNVFAELFGDPSYPDYFYDTAHPNDLGHSALLYPVIYSIFNWAFYPTPAYLFKDAAGDDRQIKRFIGGVWR